MGMTGFYVRLTDDDAKKALTDAAFATTLLRSKGTGERPILDIHKSWNGLHYVLTGEPHGGKPPLSDVIMGGQPTGVDPGYGPARVLTSQKVAELSDVLEKLGEEGFKRNFDQCDFERPDVYVYGDSGEDLEEIYEELLGYFQRLRSFYKDAANKAESMMTCIL